MSVVRDLGVSKEVMRLNEVIRVSINPDRLVSLYKEDIRTQTQSGDRVKTHREDGHLPAKERGCRRKTPADT